MKRILVSLVLSLSAFAAAAGLIELKTTTASCRLDTVGARVLSLKCEGQELLWCPESLAKIEGDWVHGGIPIAWPWFGRVKPGSNENIHGFAWTREFTVRSRTETPSKAEVVLSLSTPEAELEYTVTLTDDLKLELVTRNVGARDFVCSPAFHPYFRVGERDQVKVTGATAEPLPISRAIDDVFPAPKGSFACYRIADERLNRTLMVFGENSQFVNIWNPGAEKDCPGTIPGDDWRRFVCVEPMSCAEGKSVVIRPGERHLLKLGVELRPGAKTTGYVGRDPRFPGCEEDRFKLPFRAVFVGAHPDDAEYDFGVAAAKLVAAGAKVTFVSVCNGDEGHQTMASADLARRRYYETQASAKTYGIERYIVMGEHDCHAEASVDLRKRVARLIRDLAPNMVVTHRTCDYHADHRATGQVMQDAAYLLGVPLFAPESPIPEILPFILYAGDQFTLPRPIRPDLVVNGEEEMDLVCKALACHDSQLFEWLPPEYGIDPKDVPADRDARLKFVRDYAMMDLKRDGEQHREIVSRLFGGDQVRCINVFERCEYSRPPCAKERAFLSSLRGFRWTD